MEDKLLRMTQREYRPGTRWVALVVEGTFFLLGVPFALTFASALLDQRLRLLSFGNPVMNIGFGAVMMVVGFLWAMWAVYIQFTMGRGTPMPVMATQRLIVEGPYRYSRNPMALGTLMIYLGLAVSLGSYSALALVLVFAALLLIYIRKVEEKEMTLRFGEAYQQYRQHTPFIVPRLRRR